MELLEQRWLLSAQSWNMAADFAADFAAGLPQDNPNGVWKYLASDGTTASLVATNGSNPNTFGVGAGWAETDGIPSYARGGVFGFPTLSMAGHGPNRVVFTAPAALDLGGVELTGMLTQATFAPDRQVQLRLYKNDSDLPFVTVDANFTTQNAIVPLPATRIAMEAGDTITLVVDGSGPSGIGVSTFAAWNLAVQELQLTGDYNSDSIVDAADYTVWRDTLGSTTVLLADGNGNGIVDPVDQISWTENFGRSLDSGIAYRQYHPGAIVVETTGVSLPDGSLLDISGSQTQGLQEALNYSAAEGWDVFVLPGTYTLNAHLDIEELQLRAFRLEDVTLNFTPAVTDYGIRFDSTMLTNLYWKGGALNAPNAAHGVLFQPRTPHPKDGPVYGTIGVVDSYFHFNAPITAGTHRVTMNTNQAAIITVTFFFANVTRQQINYIGTRFDPINIFEPARTDDPIPFDIFSTAGRVTVNAPTTSFHTGDPGTVFLPDGSTLDTIGTQTFGLQEAFDYAAAHDLDVVVFGRGIRNSSPFTDVGLYNLFAPLEIGDLTNRQYHIYAVTFGNAPETGSLTLGDMTNSTFEMTGQLVGPGTDSVFIVRPDGPGVTNSTIRVQAVVGSTGHFDPNNSNTTVRLDSTLASISDNFLYFHEVNIGYFGIKIMNPSATTEFARNLVRTLHTHSFGHIGVQAGEVVPNAERIHHNTFEIRTDTDAFGVYPEASLQVWGDYNSFDLVAGYRGQKFGAKFEPGSNNNTLRYTIYAAATPIADYGTDNSFAPHGSGSGAAAEAESIAALDANDGASGSALGSPRNSRIVRRATERQSWPTTTGEELLLAISSRSPDRERQVILMATDLAFDMTNGDDFEPDSWQSVNLNRSSGAARPPWLPIGRNE